MPYDTGICQKSKRTSLSSCVVFCFPFVVYFIIHERLELYSRDVRFFFFCLFRVVVGAVRTLALVLAMMLFVVNFQIYLYLIK